MKSVKVTISLPGDFNLKVDDYCKRTGLKKSSLIRMLLEKHLLNGEIK